MTTQAFPKMVIGVTCGWVAAEVGADEIVHGGTTYGDVRIVDLEGGNIAFRTLSGAFRYAPLAEVERIRVDSLGMLGDLNEAEARLEKNDYVRALVHYERTVRLASGFWERLARARYILACDRGDRIDTIAQQFRKLLSDESGGASLAAELLPVVAPSRQSRGTARALKEIETVIDDVPSQSGRVLLEMLRFHIVRRSGRGDAIAMARELVRQPIPRIIATRPVYRVYREALATMLESGAVAEVLRAANEGLEDAPEQVLPELLLIKAAALMESASDDEGAIRAGWAAARLVIHYRDDVLAPEALLMAARVHERIGRIPTALQLLGECMNHDRISAVTKARATELATRLKTTG